MDPIHTIRAAKRMHLKDGCFVSLAPPSVFAGHLRAVQGRIAWTGPASAVERGEEVLEVWGKLVLPGMALAGVDPLRMAARALPEGRRAAARPVLEALPAEEQRALAMQTLVECAAAGVLHPILDLRGASGTRARASVEAFLEVGLRGALEWAPAAGDAEAAALDAELREHALVRRVDGPAARASLEAATRGAAIPEGAWLACGGETPDAWALLRALEARESGLGLRALAATYAALGSAFGTPFGSLLRGAWFDVVFLDYEMPARLDDGCLRAFLLGAFGPWSVEAAAVGGVPIVKRHEVLTADREALAREVAGIVAAVG